MAKDYGDAVGNAIDFDVINGVMNLKWLRSFINSRYSFWFTVPNMVFEKKKTEVKEANVKILNEI